jgi:hypothetical protein
MCRIKTFYYISAKVGHCSRRRTRHRPSEAWDKNKRQPDADQQQPRPKTDKEPKLTHPEQTRI